MPTIVFKENDPLTMNFLYDRSTISVRIESAPITHLAVTVVPPPSYFIFKLCAQFAL